MIVHEGSGVASVSVMREDGVELSLSSWRNSFMRWKGNDQIGEETRMYDAAEYAQAILNFLQEAK